MKYPFLKSLLLLSLIGGTLVTWAADTVPQKIDHFALIGADSTKVGEAIDITVEARDKDDKVIPTYRGSIFFQASDYNATLPSQGKAIQFAESDNGVKKLSKAVIFKKTGEQTLEVSDAIEDASGKKTIRVDAADTITTSSGESITIITPENNAILNAGDLITVSGYGKKNSKINIKLNGTDISTVVAGDDGLYSKTLPALTQQSNIIVAELLDGTNKVTGTAQVRFSMSNTEPTFTNLTVTPNSTVEASTGVTFIVEADSGLAEVNVNLDGSVVGLKESSAGKYVGTTLAPTKPGTYPLSVSLKNNLSQGTSKANVATLTVTEKAVAVATPKFVNVKIETIGTKVVFTFGVENLPADLVKFKIAYGTNVDSLSEQVLTKDAKDILTASGTYSWYIDKLDTKDYTFRIFGVKADQSLIADFASEALTATIGTPGCTIGNVGEVSVQTSADKSILSWLSVTGAISYNIYKYTAAGDTEFIQNTKDTNYTLFLSSGSVVHEDFGIKALCDDKTESADMTKISKVQTGPGQIALLVIISALIGIFFVRRRFSY